MKVLTKLWMLVFICLSMLLLYMSVFAADTDLRVFSPGNWAKSPHANAASESFTHWDDEGEIPVACAACHSRTGFLDYMGADGSVAGVTNMPSPTGTVVDCDTCHNDVVENTDTVVFPSGETVTGITSSVQCLVCHQGRASTVSVNDVLAGLDEDVVSGELSFINVHYRAAAATLYGTAVKGGYEYAGREYAGQFLHVPPYNSCAGCHDAHLLDVPVEECATCHQGESLVSIRSSSIDVDADGDKSEGIADEIAALHTRLNSLIGDYSRDVIKVAIKYDPEHYPYFFTDADSDGELSDKERSYLNRYQNWTPRLLKAAYNYQFVAKDPGAYAHNPRYVLQLLYDSIESLAVKLEATNDYTRP